MDESRKKVKGGNAKYITAFLITSDVAKVVERRKNLYRRNPELWVKEIEWNVGHMWDILLTAIQYIFLIDRFEKWFSFFFSSEINFNQDKVSIKSPFRIRQE